MILNFADLVQSKKNTDLKSSLLERNFQEVSEGKEHYEAQKYLSSSVIV